MLRAALRRSLPDTLKVGRGFMVDKERRSRQIDILIYDAASPVFFRDGDLVTIPPHFVRAIIEVKSHLRHDTLRSAILSLAENRSMVPGTAQPHILAGLFSFDSDNISHDVISQALTESCGERSRLVNLVSLGKDQFVRFWHRGPEGRDEDHKRWHSYLLRDMAFGYFIHNVLTHVTPEYSGWEGNLWFPEEGKEDQRIGQIPATWPED